MSTRAILNAYTDESRQIELAGAAIGIIEGMRGVDAARAIRALQAAQQKALPRLDRAAAKLGAPYPSNVTGPGTSQATSRQDEKEKP